MSNKSLKRPGQWKAYVTLAWYSFRAQTRNPATFAFGFIFPIVFISIFGLIGNSTPDIKLGITENSDTDNAIVSVLEEQNYVTLIKSDTATLTKELSQGKIIGILSVNQTNETPPHYSVILTRSSAFPQETAALSGVISGIVDKTNLRLSGISEPPIAFEQKEAEGRKPRYIDFAVPGQIGFALLSTAIFGTVFGLIYLKKALVLKRMFATPTKALTILLAQGTSRLFMALLQTVLIIAVAVFVFGFYLPNGFLTFIDLMIISTLGLIAFLGFGYFIAGLTNDENAASPITNLVTLPQFLLSGTFFPTESLPTWLQPIATNLPLYYFNTAVRKVTTEGGALSDTWPYMLGLLVWGGAMYLIAAKTFKWQ